MTTIAAVPVEIAAAWADPLLADALANVLDTLLRLRRQEASCAILALEAQEAGSAPEAALRQARLLAKSRRGLGDAGLISEHDYEEPFHGVALAAADMPEGDWAQALGDDDLLLALTSAARQLRQLQRLARGVPLAPAVQVMAARWALAYVAEEDLGA